MRINRGRILKIYRDGRRHERLLEKQLPVGAQANLETLAAMKQIVVEDAREGDLKNFVMREIVGLDKRTLDAQVEAAFKFCRDKIVYESEQSGFETVADLWSCLYALNADHPIGDCSIKSVALATCLRFLNLKPYFTALQQIPGADYFNHVYVTVVIDGRETALDPTPAQFCVGDALDYETKLHFMIFD